MVKYICQVQNGYMLAEESGNHLVLCETGYPYPDTEKSNFEMLRSLIRRYKGVEHSSTWYRDNYSGFKEYAMYCLSTNTVITATGILEALTKTSREKQFKNNTASAVYRLPKYKDILDMDGYLFVNPVHIDGIRMLHRVVGNGSLLGDLNKLDSLIESNTSFLVFTFSDIRESFKTLIDTSMNGLTELDDTTLDTIESLFISIGFTYKQFVAAVGIMGIQQCMSRYYEFNDMGFNLLYEDLAYYGRNSSSVKDRIGRVSREFGIVVCRYTEKVHNYDAHGICSFVYGDAHKLLTEDSFIHMYKDSMTSGKELFRVMLRLAAMAYIGEDIDFNDKLISEIVTTAWNTILRKHASLCTRVFGQDGSVLMVRAEEYSTKKAELGILYNRFEAFRDELNRRVRFMKPTRINDNYLDFDVSRFISKDYATAMAYMLSIELSEIKYSEVRTCKSDDDIKYLLKCLYPDIARMMVFNQEYANKVTSALTYTFYNEDTRVVGSTISTYPDYVEKISKMSLFGRIFLRFSHLFFINDESIMRDIAPLGSDYKVEYIWTFTLCFHNYTKNLEFAVDVSDESVLEIRDACILDFLFNLINNEGILLEEDYLDVNNVCFSFDSKTQQVKVTMKV